MHLINILNSLDASNSEKKYLITHFKTNLVSFNSVEKELSNIRKNGL